MTEPAPPADRAVRYTSQAVATHYDTLGIAPTASADEIKRAFRREIARYHPDKVQHLGQEFQEIAADKAAGLTQAYTTLSDASARIDYDAQLKTGVVPPSDPGHPEPASQTEEAPARPEPTERPASEGASRPEPKPSSGRGSMFSQDRAGASDLVRKAAVMRFRQAAHQEFGQCEEAPVQGFDVSCAPPKGGFSAVPFRRGSLAGSSRRLMRRRCMRAGRWRSGQRGTINAICASLSWARRWPRRESWAGPSRSSGGGRRRRVSSSWCR